MTVTIATLQAELESLKVKRDSIDIEALQAHADQAQAELAAHKEIWPDPEATRLRQAESAARQALQNGRDAQRDIARLIAPLESMLTAPARRASAQRDWEALQAQVTQAQGAVDAAAQVMAELRERVADTSAELAALRESSAKAVFDAAKEGRALKAESPDRGPLLALEAALAMAEGEHQAALDVLGGVQGRVAQAEQALQHATEGVATLQFELNLRDFVGAAVAFRRVVPGLVGTLTDDIAQRVYALEA